MREVARYAAGGMMPRRSSTQIAFIACDCPSVKYTTIAVEIMPASESHCTRRARRSVFWIFGGSSIGAPALIPFLLPHARIRNDERPGISPAVRGTRSPPAEQRERACESPADDRL